MLPDGLITVPSSFDPKQTMERLVAAVEARGMSVMARIDHAAGAKAVGLELRPTEVLIFGNPKAGTPLMQVAQTIGIDLPLRALVYEDERGKTHLAYDDPSRSAARHGVPASSASVAAMRAALGAVAKVATSYTVS
jgi:uncharacterized protein (DUF302 family)